MTAISELSVEKLRADDCWALLPKTGLGRLAMAVDNRPEIYPLNYLITDEVLYFRSAPGSKLADLAGHRDVAFEIEGHRRRLLWSVIIHGRAERLNADAAILASGVLDLESWSPTDKWNYVRVVPAEISGRRFMRTRHARNRFALS